MSEQVENTQVDEQTGIDTATVEVKKTAKTKDEPVKVSFEVWYSIRHKSIPTHHRKEVIKADFNGQKMPATATLAEFDTALRRYGIKLRD